MKPLSKRLPKTQKLTAILKSILGARRLPVSALQILDRRRNPFGSSFPSEIVTCRLGDGSELRLLCKYGIGRNESGFGHRGGVSYESVIYRHVLNPLRQSKPTYFGTYHDRSQGSTLLVLEYIEDAEQVSRTTRPGSMKWAAHWIATFHATNEKLLKRNSLRVLKRYDHGYYSGWVQRTAHFAGRLSKRFPWLPTVCNRFLELIPSVLDLPRTIVHGEYTVGNVLICRGHIYPTDWESAAIGFGEIDLASLTERWSRDITRQCEREYQKTRWPEGAPGSFAHTPAIARAYLQFRWLGDKKSWTRHRNSLWRFDTLRQSAEELELI